MVHRIFQIIVSTITSWIDGLYCIHQSGTLKNSFSEATMLTKPEEPRSHLPTDWQGCVKSVQMFLLITWERHLPLACWVGVLLLLTFSICWVMHLLRKLRRHMRHSWRMSGSSRRLICWINRCYRSWELLSDLRIKVLPPHLTTIISAMFFPLLFNKIVENACWSRLRRSARAMIRRWQGCMTWIIAKKQISRNIAW